MTNLSLNCSRLFKCDAKTLWRALEEGALFKFTNVDAGTMKHEFKEGGEYYLEWENGCGAVKGIFKQIVKSLYYLTTYGFV